MTVSQQSSSTTTATDQDATVTRATRINPPGLATLRYQGGEYLPTVQRMLAQLTGSNALARLNPDAYDDWSIALLHAWAVVTDVLTFYQERLINEGYLGTATERRSILELARAIGYELRPGLAAQADLALTVAAADDGQPQQLTVPKGGAVQSTPQEGKLPQIFETSRDQAARTEWNLLRPYIDLNPLATTLMPPLPIAEPSIRVAGTRSDLPVGAYILIVEQQPPPTAAPAPATATTDEQTSDLPAAWLIGQLTAVESDPQQPYSLLTWKQLASYGDLIQRPAIYVFRQEAKLFGYAQGAVYYDQEEKASASDAAATAPSPTARQSRVRAPTTTSTATTTPAEPPAPPKVAKWEPRTYSLPNADINTCVVNAQGWLFVGTKHDVYRSTDEGANWTAVGVDLIRRNVTALALADNLLFAGTSTGGIYLSYDNGDNWTPVSGDVVAPDVTVENKTTEFNVKYTEVLPKVPVAELAAEKKGEDITLYAATAKGLFVSEDGGKSWKEKTDVPPLTNRPTATEQRAQLLQAAQGLLRNQALGWLTTLIQLCAKSAGTLKWLGLDLWDFLRTRVQREPTAQAITALALVPKGNQSTVVIGTETGKFDLKPGIRRWVVVVAILLLILLQQFLLNRNRVNTLQLIFADELIIPADKTSTAPNAKVQVSLFTQGLLEVEPEFQIEKAANYHLALRADDHIFPATVDKAATQAILSANLPLSGTMQLNKSEATSYTVELIGMTTLTVTGLPTTTLDAISATGGARTHLVINASARITEGGVLWPPAIELISGTFSSAFEAAPLEDDRIEWLSPIWSGIQELFQATIIPGWQAIKSFASELWGALPAPVRGFLAPLYTEIIAPVVRFIDDYLVRPLLNDTAATLVQASGVLLAVLALLLAWQYTARRMSERKTVRLNEPVYTLAVRDNGQLFAGTDSGVYRSLEDDPDLPFYKRTPRILLYQLFKDKEMEPINVGLPLKEGKGPPVRALAINNAGALLLGTADGQIFRSDKNGDQWYPYSQGLIPKPEESAASDASARALKAAKTLVITKQGQFVTGAVGANPVEDQWFTNQAGVPPADQAEPYSGVVDLDTIYPDVAAPGWLLLRRAKDEGFHYTHYPISAVDTLISRDFATLGAYQRLTVTQRTTTALNAYPRRRTAAWIGSELVPLFDNTPVAGRRIRLDRYVPGLTAGQRLIIRGQRLRGLILSANLVLQTKDKLDDYQLQPNEIVQVLAGPLLYSEESVCPPKLAESQPWQLQTRTGFIGTVNATLAQIRWIAPASSDPVVSEVITIKCVAADLQHTTVFLREALTHAYDRATVSIFGNIVPATHGETVADEVLGSGSGTQAFERFTLQEQPLTYVSTPTTAGLASTLAVKVNRIAWAEEPYLYGLPRDRRAYIARQDAAGNTTITFGDGKQGARLPTGTEQITATYRIGSGPDGNVPADTINQRQNLPDAVSAATNPLPATGGLPPEVPEVARRQAPRMVRVMGRIVALTDYVDFAQQFPGIGRARSRVSGIGKQRVIELTIADSAGNEVPANATLITNLQQAINANRAVTIPKVAIKSYEPRYFKVAATLRIDPDHVARQREIEEQARQRLIAYFAFDQRGFGQAVTIAEVTAQLQAVTGVVAVVDATIAFNDEETRQNVQLLRAAENQLLRLNHVTGITLKLDPLAAAPAQPTLRRGAR